jgi:hypothetical protein
VKSCWVSGRGSEVARRHQSCDETPIFAAQSFVTSSFSFRETGTSPLFEKTISYLLISSAFCELRFGDMVIPSAIAPLILVSVMS